MASINSCMQQGDDYGDGDVDVDVDMDNDDYGSDHLPHLSTVSRLSMCSTTNEDEDHEYDGDDDDEVGGNLMSLSMSRLSIKSFYGDADEEFSDSKEVINEMSFDDEEDSEKEPSGCYSLPETPAHGRNELGLQKEYTSENEARPKMRRNLMRRKRRRLIVEKKREEEMMKMGECGVVVMARAKGGRRSLCMDMEEVKACRDLGFELEHERMVEMPSRLSISVSGSTGLDTASSGGNSPIANWRISSPGDDPRDVKARLKVWAQAVAFVTASRHGS